MNGAPWFVNSVAGVETLLEPYDLLKALLRIEEDMGRIKNKGLDSRIIDLDILFYDQLTISVNDLVIPHPSAHLRRFVLTPLAEIAPNFVHPILHLSVSQLLTELKDGNPVVEKMIGLGDII
jgi:2-amino-4-hydroxy-6-hydroxymethyldihydropteridine diphosphokinase